MYMYIDIHMYLDKSPSIQSGPLQEEKQNSVNPLSLSLASSSLVLFVTPRYTCTCSSRGVDTILELGGGGFGLS